MKPIVVLGSMNMDLVIRSPRMPQPGETLIGGPFQIFPGGKGTNQAVAIARMGVPVALIGRLGSDAFGDALITAALNDGVDTGAVSRDSQAATGVALITVEANGQNTIIVAPGANSNLTPTLIAPYTDLIRSASLLVMQLEVPLDTVAAAARTAREAGVKVLLNPAPACTVPAELLADANILVPNQLESGIMTGEQDPQAGARKLLAFGGEAVLVTLGGDGVYILSREQEILLPAYPVEAVDTVAAGDAFMGAFAAATAEGRSLLDAARWGNAAGAIAVTRPGAQPSLPSRAEVHKMLASTAGGSGVLPLPC